MKDQSAVDAFLNKVRFPISFEMNSLTMVVRYTSKFIVIPNSTYPNSALVGSTELRTRRSSAQTPFSYVEELVKPVKQYH